MGEESNSAWTTAKAAELAFVEDGIRLLQRQREVFLGFSVTVVAAASLQVAKTSTSPKHPHPHVYVFVLAAMVAVAIAGWLIWRSSREILKGAVYAAFYLEPDIPGRSYQTGLHRLRVRGLDEDGRKLHSPANGASIGYALSIAALGALVAYLWIVARTGPVCGRNLLIAIPGAFVLWMVVKLLLIAKKKPLEKIVAETLKMEVETKNDPFEGAKLGVEVSPHMPATAGKPGRA